MKAWAAVAGLALEAYETDGTEVPGRGDLPARLGVSPGTTRRVTGPLSGAGLVPGRRLCREDIAADPVLMVLAGAAMAGRLAALYPARERSLRAAGREFLDAASLPGAGILLRHRAEDLPAEARSLIDAHLAGHGEAGPAPPGISDRQAGECADRVMNWITAAGQQGVMRDPVRSTSEIITRTRDISPVIADAVRSSDASPAGGWLASAAVRAEVDRRLAARAPAGVRSLRPDRTGATAPAARRAG